MIQRWVLRLRNLLKLLSLSVVGGAALFVYHQCVTNPYHVRYFVTADQDDLRSQDVSIFSVDGTTNPVFVAISCSRGKLTDIRFRPVLETGREWSLREMLPEIPEGKTILAKDFPKTIEELADRHLAGGLAGLQNLEDFSLRGRIHELLTQKQWQLSRDDRSTIEDAFLRLRNRHDTLGLPFPKGMRTDDRSRMRAELDRVLQGWERDVNTVTTELVLRWQSLTGTNLIPPPAGVGGETPLFVSIPPLRSKSGAVVNVSEETGLGPNFVVSAGEEGVYPASAYDELKMPDYELAFLNHPGIFAVVFLIVVIFARIGITLLRWPKQLNDVDLFRSAQSDDADELWEELRKRQPWVDRYITEQFLRARPARVPTQDVLLAFWRILRETFRAKPVDARNKSQVRKAIFDVLDKALFDALR